VNNLFYNGGEFGPSFSCANLDGRVNLYEKSAVQEQ
jgi:hypothetical protein